MILVKAKLDHRLHAYKILAYFLFYDLLWVDARTYTQSNLSHCVLEMSLTWSPQNSHWKRIGIADPMKEVQKFLLMVLAVCVIVTLGTCFGSSATGCIFLRIWKNNNSISVLGIEKFRCICKSIIIDTASIFHRTAEESALFWKQNSYHDFVSR